MGDEFRANKDDQGTRFRLAWYCKFTQLLMTGFAVEDSYQHQ
jgi:hypothetical protein